MATIVSENRVLTDIPLPALNGANASEDTATFGLPTDFIDTNLVDLPILTFRISTGDDGATPLAGLTIEVRSSTDNFAAVDNLEATLVFNSDTAETLHEVINSGRLDATVATNAFRFQITAGDGEAVISDVYLMIKRQVPGPVNTMTGSGVGGD